MCGVFEIREYPDPVLFTPSQNLMKNWYFCFDFVSPYSKLLLNWDRILSFVCFLPNSWHNKVYYAHPEANIFLLSFESSKSDQWIQRYNFFVYCHIFLCIVVFDCCFNVHHCQGKRSCSKKHYILNTLIFEINGKNLLDFWCHTLYCGGRVKSPSITK